MSKIGKLFTPVHVKPLFESERAKVDKKLMLIYNLVKLKQPQRGERAKKQEPHLILQTNCWSEDHEMTPGDMPLKCLRRTPTVTS